MKEQYRLASFASTAMLVLAGVVTTLSASLVPMAREFGIATTRAGILYTLHFAGFMSAIVLSLLVHGLRGRLMLTTVTAAVYAAALLGLGAAEVLVLAGIGLFVAGGAGGIMEAHVSTLQVMTAKDEAEAGRVVSLTQVFFALGALAAPIYLSLDATGSAAWRTIFFVLAGFAALTFVIAVSTRAHRFEYVRGQEGKLDRRSLIRVAVALALYVGAEVTLFGWIPTMMELYRDVPVSHARLAPSVFWIGMLGGRLVIARLTSRVKPVTLLTLSSLIGAVAAVMITLVAAEPLLWVFVVLASLAAAGIWPLIVATSGSAGHETATTIVIAAGGLGGAVFPYIAGLTAEILPGNFIPIIAAPLLLAVLVLSRVNARAAR